MAERREEQSVAVFAIQHAERGRPAVNPRGALYVVQRIEVADDGNRYATQSAIAAPLRVATTWQVWKITPGRLGFDLLSRARRFVCPTASLSINRQHRRRERRHRGRVTSHERALLKTENAVQAGTMAW